MTDHEAASNGESTSREVFCVACREPIRRGATKCVHCGSFQNWRRHVAVSDAFLALLVALVSVLSLSAPLLKNALRPSNSVVKVVFQDAQGPYLFAIASNSGSKPGTVGHAELRVSGLDAFFGATVIAMRTKGSAKSKPDMVWGILPLSAKGWDEEKTFIPAGESRPLRFVIADEAWIELSDRLRDGLTKVPDVHVWFQPTFEVRFAVVVIQFDGTRETQVYDGTSDGILQNYVWRFAEGSPARERAKTRAPSGP